MEPQITQISQKKTMPFGSKNPEGILLQKNLSNLWNLWFILVDTKTTLDCGLNVLRGRRDIALLPKLPRIPVRLP